jgi:phosphoribosyl 1,2-cyclic phosphate phosphodiesterase
LREQLLAADTASVDFVVVTHDHADHCHGIDDLRPMAQSLGHEPAIFGREATIDRLRKRFAYAFEGTPFYPAMLVGSPVGEQMELGEARLRFVDQPHGGIISLGIRFDEGPRSAGYAIDFHELTDEMAALYEGLDLWICDCLRREPHPTHANLDSVLGWARDLKVGRLLLTHLDKSMDYATLSAELPDWAAPAFDGQEIML